MAAGRSTPGLVTTLGTPTARFVHAYLSELLAAEHTHTSEQARRTGKEAKLVTRPSCLAPICPDTTRCGMRRMTPSCISNAEAPLLYQQWGSS